MSLLGMAVGGLLGCADECGCARGGAIICNAEWGYSITDDCSCIDSGDAFCLFICARPRAIHLRRPRAMCKGPAHSLHVACVQAAAECSCCGRPWHSCVLAWAHVLLELHLKREMVTACLNSQTYLQICKGQKRAQAGFSHRRVKAKCCKSCTHGMACLERTLLANTNLSLSDMLQLAPPSPPSHDTVKPWTETRLKHGHGFL